MSKQIDELISSYKPEGGYDYLMCGRYCVLVSDTDLEMRKIIEDLGKTVALYDDLDFLDGIERMPEVFSFLPSSVIDYISDNRNRDIEEIVSILKDRSSSEKKNMIGKAYAVSMLEDSVDVQMYDTELVDLLSYKDCVHIDVDRGSLDVVGDNTYFSFNMQDDVQNSGGRKVLMNSKKYQPKRNFKDKWQRIQAEVKTLADGISVDKLVDLIERKAPSARSKTPDAGYNVYDLKAFVPRRVYYENWIFQALERIILEQNIKYVCVTVTSNVHKDWYKRLSNNCDLVVDYYETTPSEEVYDHMKKYADRSLFLRCPFMTCFGGPFAPGFSNGSRSIVEYHDTYKGVFLKGMYEDVENGFKLCASMRDTYPIPFRVCSTGKGRLSFQMAKDVEAHAYYSVLPHRDAGIFVQRAQNGGDLCAFSGGKDLAAHYSRILFYTLKRNELVLPGSVSTDLYKAIGRAFHVNGSTLRGNIGRCIGRFFPLLDMSLQSVKFSVSHGLAQLLYMAGHGLCNFEIGYQDFPQSLYHMREEIIDAGLLTGTIKVLSSIGLESRFLIQVPFILRKREMDHPVTGMGIMDASVTSVSSTGRILGNIDNPVTKISFYEGDDIFDRAKNNAGINRVVHNRTYISTQKGRRRKLKKVRDSAVTRCLLEACSVRAYTAVALFGYLKERMNIKRPRMRKILDILITQGKISSFVDDKTYYYVH